MTWRNPYYFELSMFKTNDHKERVIEWVKDNLDGTTPRGSKRYRWVYYKRRRKNYRYGCGPKTRIVKTLIGFQIADDEDAMLFKMTWR